MISSVQASSSLQVPQQSMLLAAQGRKPGSLPKPGMPAGLGHIRETLPMPFILQAPEEQTDNWDDDFEEGISLTKLHGAYTCCRLLPLYMRGIVDLVVSFVGHY